MAIDKITTAAITDANITTAKLAYDAAPFRNIIINGDMSLAQRATSASSLTGNGYHTVDRFQTVISSIGTWTQTQSTDVPTGQGFAKSLKMDCTTADASPASGDNMYIRQEVEGQNLQYLKKGTSSAESTTLSFWVKSNKTGTYIAELLDFDNSRQISQSYTISSANTWEKKTLTFAGDTTGAFDNDNAQSLMVAFWLGAGSDFTSGTLSTSWTSTTNANRAVGQVNLADSTSNEWYVTGVQLEAGTTASEFEFLPFDVNLQRCSRYYERLFTVDILAVGYSGSTANAISMMPYVYLKRANGSVTLPATGSGSGQISHLNTSGAYPPNMGSIAVFSAGVNSFSVNQTGMTSAYSAAGFAFALYGGVGESIEIDAEL